jgi:hypothetical protein
MVEVGGYIDLNLKKSHTPSPLWKGIKDTFFQCQTAKAKAQISPSGNELLRLKNCYCSCIYFYTLSFRVDLLVGNWGLSEWSPMVGPRVPVLHSCPSSSKLNLKRKVTACFPEVTLYQGLTSENSQYL